MAIEKQSYQPRVLSLDLAPEVPEISPISVKLDSPGGVLGLPKLGEAGWTQTLGPRSVAWMHPRSYF